MGLWDSPTASKYVAGVTPGWELRSLDFYFLRILFHFPGKSPAPSLPGIIRILSKEGSPRVWKCKRCGPRAGPVSRKYMMYTTSNTDAQELVRPLSPDPDPPGGRRKSSCLVKDAYLAH